MKEASFYISKLNKVKCVLCPHTCVLEEGQIGLCRVRQNIEGTLFSLSYGMVSAMHVDPIEKKPLYHFLPGSKSFSISTNGCVLSCLNCQNWQISQNSVDEHSAQKLAPESIVKMVLDTNCESISYTYTDPVVFYEFMLDVAEKAKDHGVKNVLVSSGYMNSRPLNNLLPYIDGANIDLKCFDDKIYNKLNGGSLKPVLKALQLINDSDTWLEITNLIIPGWTDDVNMIEKMCRWLVKEGFGQVPLHFSRFVPTYHLSDLNLTSLEVLLKARQIAAEVGMKYVYIGNVHKQNVSSTFCPNCKTEMINRDGGIRIANLRSDGSCHICGDRIDGVWE
nr:AmmeMemoRadiSam system radical SAM enzyme [uncultured Carboxylicivirga sp.]